MSTATRMRSGTPEWHERRRHSIGASDSPIILGVSPYADACRLNLAWQKRGLIPVESMTDDLDIGHRLESVGRQWLEDTVGGTVDYVDGRDFVVGDVAALATKHDHVVAGTVFRVAIHATLDGQIKYHGHRAVVEHKLVRYNNPDHAAWWDGPNAVPVSVQVQCQHQMLVAGCDRALIVLFSQKRCDFELRVLEADQEFQAWLVKHLAVWWQRYVVDGRDPDPGYNAGTAAAIRARWPRPEPGKQAVLDEQALHVVNHWLLHKYTAREHSTRAKEYKAKIDRMMEDAEIATLPDGRALKRTIARDGKRLLRVVETP